MNYTRDSLLSWIAVGNVAGVRGSLLAGANPNQKDEMGSSALGLAVRSRRKDVVAILLQSGATVDEDVLRSSIGQHDDYELHDFILREKENRA